MAPHGPKDDPARHGSARSDQTGATSDRLRLPDLRQRQAYPFDWVPDRDAMAAIAADLELIDLRKARLAGRLLPVGKSDWDLEAKLGATVTQPCVATLAPVRTRIDETVTRRFRADPGEIPLAGEIEMPEDDSVEPMPDEIDLADVASEALALALAANLRPGDELLSPVGKPYDTLEEVIGIRPSKGSLAEYGITYRQVELLEDGYFDYPAIREAINERTKLVTIQRSKGYQTRPSYSVEKIGELIAFIKEIKPDVICMVDNCYGEFVEKIEPSDVGADMIVGSLIKNPGGGLAPIGGYIAGREDLIENCGYRLTSPGLGKEVGASLGVMQSFYQGFFLAPTVVNSAVKGAVFAANIYERLGYGVIPNGTESRHDIIQAVELGSAEGVIAFCKGIQAAAPVDSYVSPEPWAMPGYDSDVIMAAGAFVQGSSIELSADGPIKPPYAVYFQGGLTWPHAKLGILKSLQNMIDAGVIELERLK